MLSKNIYLLYPPGSSGSYLHWCIHRSEEGLAPLTIDDPLNKNDNEKFGGAGTAHLHERIPTHQGIHQHLCWMVYNRPTEKKVFLINSHILNSTYSAGNPEFAIRLITASDPDPVIVVITDNGILDNRKYGSLNTITKWPIFFKANQYIEKHFDFDSFNCKNSITARNLFVEHYHEMFPYIDHVDDNILNPLLGWNKNWYDVRNLYNGHEVNEKTYVLPKLEVDHLYNISLTDIVSNKFPDWFNDFTGKINAGTFDTKFVKEYHSTYINAQQNLQWFNEIKLFRKTLVLTDFLRSHSLLQAFVIMELKNDLPDTYDWKTASIDEIVQVAVSCKF